MGMIKRLLGIEDQTKLIEDKFNKLQEKVFAEMANLKSENNVLKVELSKRNDRITELLTKVRDQNEADLLLECKKVEKKILEGEKKPDTFVFNQLQNLQNAYQQQLGSSRNTALGLMGGMLG